MLIQFSVKNFKTFKDKVTLSLVASNYDKDTREDDNVITLGAFNLRLLKSAVIYGANASGKSKLIEALGFMKRFVINSSKETQVGDQIDVEPFRLNTETENETSEFEVIFIHSNVMYRYGFEANLDNIVSEWLYYKPKTREVELFYRENNTYNIHPRDYKKGRSLADEDWVRSNALLLSVAAQFNDRISMNIIDWFKKLKTISGLNERSYKGYTMSKLKEQHSKQEILTLLQAADFDIRDIQLEPLEINNLPEDMPKELKDEIIKDLTEGNRELIAGVLTSHQKYNNSKELVGSELFSMEEDESSGTRKFFALTGPILDVLENGHILVVDELDSKLHPNLVCKLVSLFNSKEVNKKNAQLIFNTHDTNLLSSGLFRRDQIWFTEKNKYGEAKLFSLADFKSDEVRKSEPFEENYIRGKYGAIPYLGLFGNLIKILSQHENEK